MSLFGDSRILQAIARLDATMLTLALEVRDVRESVQALGRREHRMAVDVNQLKADLAALVASEKAAEDKEQADLALISDNIANLKAQVATGGGVTQADLDALDSQVLAVSSGLSTIVSNLDTAAKGSGTAPVAPPVATPFPTA